MSLDKGQEEFSNDDVSIMLRFLHPDDRWPRLLVQTSEIESAYRDWLNTDCVHVARELRSKSIKGGATQIVRVCVRCGLQFGGPVSKKSVPNPDAIPELGGLNDRDFYDQRLAVWRAKQLEFYQKQAVEGERDYAQYLQSPEWKAKRQLVLQRSGGKCEGCWSADATQVHHLTYEHIYNEFLWELVAICNECHRRAHPEKHSHDEFDD